MPPDSNRRAFVPSPAKFDGTLEELYERFVLPNLPAVGSVRRCHDLLVEYVERNDPLFLVRHVTGTTRGETYRTSDGSRFMPTDNAPVWWMHYITFRDELPEGDEFVAAMESAPHHFFDVARGFPGNISSAGWHVAHILAVKDRNTDYKRWTRDELMRRFVRNVHPCNHFLLPKAGWQRWGGDPGVIGFFAAAYEDRYRDVWLEFLSIAQARPTEIATKTSALRYVCVPSEPGRAPKRSYAGVLSAKEPKSVDESLSKEQRVRSTSETIPTYHARRLLFRAAVIEPLAPYQRFRVVTPDGVFEMTKAEFYATFRNVAESASYRDTGIYHYPALPRKALQFLRGNTE